MRKQQGVAMAKSSLAKQLEALRHANQHLEAIAVVTDRQKTLPSLVFPLSEAAEYDERIIWEVGRSGMQELCQMEGAFFRWRDRFYETAALDGDRALLTFAQNAVLDDEIRQFLRLLSPYFLDNAAHRALEWMIRKYRVHVLNVDAVFDCIIPYHESVAFVRVLQLLNLDGPSAASWNFIRDKQTEAQAVSRRFLALRCTVDGNLLRSICESVKWQVAHAGDRKPACLVSFFTLLVLEFLQCFERADQNAALLVLPMIREFVSGSSRDLQLAGYAIAIFLAKQGTLRARLKDDIKALAKEHAVDCAALVLFSDRF